MMILFNVVTCVLSILGIVAVMLILEDRLRTVHRVALGVMAGTMFVSTWAALAGISGTDGWVFVGFRCGLMAHLFCEYTPRLQVELMHWLTKQPAEDEDAWVRVLRGLSNKADPYTNPTRPGGDTRP